MDVSAFINLVFFHFSSTSIHPLPERSVFRPLLPKYPLCVDWSSLTGLSKNIFLHQHIQRFDDVTHRSPDVCLSAQFLDSGCNINRLLLAPEFVVEPTWSWLSW